VAEALLVAPDLLGKLTVHRPADKERATKLIAARMGANPDTDIRPGLLVQLAFAAADFAFQRWVSQSTKKPRALDHYVTEHSRRSGARIGGVVKRFAVHVMTATMSKAKSLTLDRVSRFVPRPATA